MGRLPEMMVTQVFDVPDVHGADPVHFAEVTDRGWNIVVRIGAQGAGAQA